MIFALILGILAGYVINKYIHSIIGYEVVENIFMNDLPIIMDKQSLAITIIIVFIFVNLYIQYGLGLIFIKYAIFISFLIVIGTVDFLTMEVYFRTIFIAIVIGTLFIIIECFLGIDVRDYMYGGLYGGGFISLIILITHGMGWGDAEICLVCGIYLGLKLTIIIISLAFSIGSIVGLIMILFKKRELKSNVPFVPFISISAILTVLYI